MALFNLLNINGQSLNSFQKGIDLVNKNINNVNNKDYARERAVFTELSNYGVTLAEAHRIFDQRYFDRYIHENQNYNFHEEINSSLANIEQIFNDIQGAGFSQELDDYFSAINDIVAEPTNMAARESFINSAKVLVSKFTSSYRMLADEKQNMQIAMQKDIEQINNLTNSLTKINIALGESSSALIPSQEKRNTLLNQRDKIIKDLSQYIDIKVRYNSNGTADIFSAKGHALVVFDTSFNVSFSSTQTTLQNSLTLQKSVLSIDGVELTDEFKKGKLAAKLEVDKTLDKAIEKLNNFVISFAKENNAQHKAGKTLDGIDGSALFLPDNNTTINIANISFNEALQQKDIAASSDGSVSNNENMKSLYALQYKKITDLDNKTFHDYYKDIVSDIANKRNFHKYLAQDSKNMIDAIDKKIQDISGVNLDEELVNLTQLQRSYEAAARVLNVTDKLLDVLMDIVR
ncbi:flagellar hook-associated protein 1 FlgK [Nitratiruptor sp. YY08-26]|uniref:flagellar hook-associated protein FlgK n=1 Tax=unclassified Nitratiruptor TaxID=2624044 RepID=UPI001915A986|nr:MULTISPECIES: flagellar hook-associated protein FlgK [unclassified Nitratiruptor]BCD61886.1 flagellar hook-associated protein 1 FlgK [Nitratiruptor sp. YY08-13]BCD65821.1 flagellar hook-associated protein 1 FlgK [Nitratiruptor sp. YY08-26]